MKNGSKIYGEGWLNFYVNWRFPIGFVLGAFTLIKEFIDAGNGGYLFVPIFLVLGILDAVVYFYRYIVYFAMRERTPKSYYMNIILLFVDSAYIAFSAAQSSFASTSFWLLFSIEFIIACLIWALPNIIYFKHRRYLFGIISSESNPRITYTIDPSSIPITPNDASNSGLVQKQYCPYCGKALPHDSVFCQYCGKRLSQ